MATHKRAHYNVDPDQPQSQKRLKTGSGSDRPFANNQGQLDPIFGQRSVLPDQEYIEEGSDIVEEGLDYGSDDKEDEETRVQRQALDYLKAVRLEATSIPTVLCAPQDNLRNHGGIHNDDATESGGYYEDGAYTAVPEESPAATNDYPWLAAENLAKQPILSRDAYFNSLLSRCEILRSRLCLQPPLSALNALSKHHGTYMGGSNKDWTTWRWRIRNTECKSAQLATMNKATVLKLLKICTKELGSGTSPEKPVVTGRMSRWVMGLLARLPDRGELGSEEIGVVRALGKKAVLMGVKLRGLHDVSGLEEEEEEDEIDEAMPDVTVPEITKGIDTKQMDEVEADDRTLPQESIPVAQDSNQDIELMRAQLLDQLEQTTATSSTIENPSRASTSLPDVDTLDNTRVIVDMILTIAGELYGQRDLLEFRQEWIKIDN